MTVSEHSYRAVTRELNMPPNLQEVSIVFRQFIYLVYCNYSFCLLMTYNKPFLKVCENFLALPPCQTVLQKRNQAIKVFKNPQ